MNVLGTVTSVIISRNGQILHLLDTIRKRRLPTYVFIFLCQCTTNLTFMRGGGYWRGIEHQAPSQMKCDQCRARSHLLFIS